MLPVVWRWKALLWARSLTREEARRPLFKLCLLAWLCSLPAAWSLIQQKAAAPHPPWPVGAGLLRWSTVWMGAAQALLAALLWIKRRKQIQDAFLLSHPSSWKTLLIYRLTISTTAVSLLFTLTLFATFHAGLLSSRPRSLGIPVLLFVLGWTLQAFVLSAAAAWVTGWAPPSQRTASAAGRMGLGAFLASVFLLTWGADWLLENHALILGLLGSSLADWGRWAWMPLQAFEGWRTGDWKSLTEAGLVLTGASLLSVVFLARPAESTGRMLWPRPRPVQRSASLVPGWLRCGKPAAQQMSLAKTAGLFAFKDLMVPMLRSRATCLLTHLVPPLLAIAVLAAAGLLQDDPGQVWSRAAAVLLAAWPARRGLSVWSQERPMAGLLRPWLTPRALFLAKGFAFLSWSLLQVLVSFLVVTLAVLTLGWTAFLPMGRLLWSALLLAPAAFLIGWAFRDRPVADGPLSPQPFSNLAGLMIYWAVVSALLIPPPMGLALWFLTPAVFLAALMAWRRLLRVEGDVI